MTDPPSHRRGRLALAGLAALALAACGSSGAGAVKIVSTSTVAATTTIAATTTTPTPTTTASPAGVSTTLAGASGSSTTLAGGSSTTAAAGDVDAQLATIGVTPTELTCVKGSVDLSTVDLEADNPGVPFMHALLTCAPDILIKSFGESVTDSLPSATPDQIKCIGRATVTVLTKLDDATFAVFINAVNFKDLPAELRAKVVTAASACGVPAADLQKALDES